MQLISGRFGTVLLLSILLLLPISQQLYAQLPNKKLVVAVREDPPFIIKDAKGGYYGLSIDLWEQVAAEQNITYDYLEFDYVPYILLALNRKVVDISINPMSSSGVRMRELDVSYPFFTSSLGMAVRIKNSNQIEVFMSNIISIEFLFLVLYLFGIVIFFGVLVWIVERRHNPIEFRSGFRGMLDGIWWSTVTISTVGYGDKTPKSSVGRIISIFWMFCAITLISSFTATITSTLTVNRLEDEVNRIQDVNKFGRLGSIEHSQNTDYLVLHNIDPFVQYITAQDALKGLADKEIDIFAHDKEALPFLLRQAGLKDKIKMTNARFNQQYYSFLLPKNSPYTEMINVSLADLVGSDTWHNLLSHYGLDEESVR